MSDQDQAVENAKKTTISYAQDWGRESHPPQLTPPYIKIAPFSAMKDCHTIESFPILSSIQKR